MGRPLTRHIGRHQRGTSNRRGVVYNREVNVTVLLFASIAEAAGVRRVEVPLQPGDTVAAVCERFMGGHPELRRFVPTLLFALDEEYVKGDAEVVPGATLALIPPVSGG